MTIENSEAAAALGRLSRGVRKALLPAERERRRQRMVAMNKARTGRGKGKGEQ